MFSPKRVAIQPWRRIIAASVTGALLAAPALALEPIEERLRRQVEALPLQPLAQDVRVADGRIFTALYAENGFRPLWTKRSNIEALIGLVGRADEEGLLPVDYHAGRLAALLAEIDRAPTQRDARRVDMDLLLTDSLLRYVYHLRFGKVDPVTLDSKWNYRREIANGVTLSSLLGIIAAEDPAARLAELLPQTPYYHRLRSALARYRDIRARGGWAEIAPGPTLERGATGTRVRQLRERLAVTGEIASANAAAPDAFDEDLELAVAEFQARHGLLPDGIVGPATLAALNVPVDARIEQLRVNMERARWITQDIEDRYIAVNIAAAGVELIRGGRVAWSARAVVGRPYRKTPVFKSTLTYLVFNPTWTVPPTILREDLLPALKTDPGRLAKRGMAIFDEADRVVDPSTIDWPNIDVRAFPYRIRQEPGAANALGRVKFMFPNPYLVYLHDTPDRELFERPERTFSSGCIRVENAMQLARLLLGDSEQWDREAIEQVVASGATKTVFLREPLTVMLLYLTVDAGPEGRMRFLKDIYARDTAVLRALNGPFVFRPPEGFTELVAPAW